MVELAKDARDKGANIIVFPELSLLGYPPEDLLLRPSLASRVKLAFELLYTVKDIVMLVGYPHIDPNGTFNSVAIIHNGQQKGFITNNACQTMAYLMNAAILIPVTTKCCLTIKG